MSITSRIFGDANEKYLKKLQPIVDRINGLEEKFEGFSNEQLTNKTRELKEGARNGLDEILPEAFALVREAAKRTLNQRHFDVQLIGGIVLHQGKIAEMKTGEGKTLAATLPVYLNALEGKGVHVITVNDYLAKRDTIWMGQIYHALGLSVGCIVHDAAYIYDPQYEPAQDGERDEERDKLGSFKVVESYLRPVERKEAYQADITYGTNNEFGFDYLRDNMAYGFDMMSQRGHHYVIVDEVDSVLIDEARTPLIISAPDTESSNWYQEFAKIIPTLDSQKDYEVDEQKKAVTLTEGGISRVEKALGMDNIYEEKGIKYVHHLEQALRAEVLFKKDRDYVVKDGEVIIVDEFTGRMMPGRRWSGGLHQAIEAKEGVQIKPESLTLASVTFQNYFRMYKKLAGMTGTAATSAEEFDKVYHLDVAIIPTNNPLVRKDLPDRVYKTQNGKMAALVREIKERHEKGQPILVGTTSISKNEYLGKLLEREGVPHQVLNAKHHEKEGEIIAQAGRLGAVTIATNMAGRGVDIILGGNPPDQKEAEKVKESGGLHVIGTERHEARRIDNQLRGRTGRQGDPGSSQFFLSLEDDVMRIFGGEKMTSLMNLLKIPEDQPIEAKMVANAIESAQSKIEGMHFDLRKHVLEYDDVMNKQRETIYRKRREILEKFNDGTLGEYIKGLLLNAGYSKDDYLKKEEEIGKEQMPQVEKIVALRSIDILWMNHLEEMESLRDSVRLRAYGQKDPLVEYKTEGHRMFQQLLGAIEDQIVNTMLKASLKSQPKQDAAGPAASTRVSGNTPGRNDPCPCGSGKKYKKCCGRNS
ncbi:MAG: preprotein translocase subunit SecA [Candidatus Pacebacteria bacterium]|nr:preprotein translocase subunit SecA [Candidatus Paceibacterota bacterium]